MGYCLRAVLSHYNFTPHVRTMWEDSVTHTKKDEDIHILSDAFAAKHR
jgi:hypothetical protein